MSRRRRAVKRSLITLAVVLILALLRGCVVRPATYYVGSHFNQGKNAVWLGIEWVNELHSITEIQQLATHLKQHQIVYVYVYVSYLRTSNLFGTTYDYAGDFISTLKQTAHDIKILAWYGVPASQMSLSKSSTR